MGKRSILITGVYGLVGSAIYRQLAKQPDQYEVFGMARRAQPSDRVAAEEAIQVPESHFIKSDLSNLEALAEEFQGMDTIVHMAADPNTEAPWESVLKNNIEVAYHVFEAAKRAGVRRVVYASTIQVSTGYYKWVEPYSDIRAGKYENVPDSFETVKTTDPPWPVNLYAASKVFGETLARVYGSSSNLSCLCIRIGAVSSGDTIVEPFWGPIFCTQNDIGRLAEKCIQAPDTLKFEIFYGMSRNKYSWTDIENAAREIGYRPEDKIGY